MKPIKVGSVCNHCFDEWEEWKKQRKKIFNRARQAKHTLKKNLNRDDSEESFPLDLFDINQQELNSEIEKEKQRQLLELDRKYNPLKSGVFSPVFDKGFLEYERQLKECKGDVDTWSRRYRGKPIAKVGVFVKQDDKGNLVFDDSICSVCGRKNCVCSGKKGRFTIW